MVQVIDTLQQYEASFVDVYDWENKNVFGDSKHMNARGENSSPLFSRLNGMTWVY